jgi:hypothetical protein
MLNVKEKSEGQTLIVVGPKQSGAILLRALQPERPKSTPYLASASAYARIVLD